MSEILTQGYTLMLVGMATVALFLGLMVATMNGAAVFFKRYAHLFPEKEDVKKDSKRTVTDDTAVVAVAIAAIKAKMNINS